MSGKYFAKPAWTALTTCPIVSALLKLGIPTRISASPISLSFSLTSSLRITPSMLHLLKGEEDYMYRMIFVKKKMNVLIHCPFPPLQANVDKYRGCCKQRGSMTGSAALQWDHGSVPRRSREAP